VGDLSVGVFTIVIIQLPENRDHETANNNSLENLGATDTGFTGSKNPGTVEKLFELHSNGSVVSRETIFVISRQGQLDKLIVDFDAVLN